MARRRFYMELNRFATPFSFEASFGLLGQPKVEYVSPVPFSDNYSTRRVVAGSTCDALRAGK